MSSINKVRFGSAPDNDVVITKPEIDPYHAVIEWDGRALTLRDLETRSGTFINGQRINALPVRKGDIVGFGSHVFKLGSEHLEKLGLGGRSGAASSPSTLPPVTPKGGAKRTMLQSSQEIDKKVAEKGRDKPVKRTMLQSTEGLSPSKPPSSKEVKSTVMQSLEDFDLAQIKEERSSSFSVAVIPPGAVSISIGYGSDNDVVIPVPQVDSTHCRLWKGGGIYVIDDLGSTNGTFVGGQRVERAQVTPSDRIELGSYRLVLSPGLLSEFDDRQFGQDAAGLALTPSGDKKVFKIGRDDEPGINDIVLDAPMVSNEHCRLEYTGSGWKVTDLGSTNGTYLNTRQRRISESIVISSDVLYFGTYRFPVSRLRDYLEDDTGHKANELSMPTDKKVMVVGRADDCDITIDAPQVSRRHARLSRGPSGMTIADLGSANGTFVNGKKVTKPVAIGPKDVVGLGSYELRFNPESGTIESSYKGDIMLQANGVTIKVDRGRKTILHDVSFTVYPTEFVGLMGPSGAGKTTLMMALNGYLPPSEGKSLINGKDLYSNYDAFRGNIGYVPQDDIIHGELTVFEALYYTAKLRLPPDTKNDEIKKIIEGVLEELEILGTKDVLIGSPAKKGISGGQRKRVNLAQELITRPSLLFLDEPTSGLASEDTINVMKLLRKLADDGRTILLTIHQPSLEAYRTMDNIVYLADGHLVYYGPTYPDSITYFNPGAKAGTPEGDLLLSDPGNALKPLAEDRRQGLDMTERATAYLASEQHKEYVARRKESGADAVSISGGSKKKTSRRFGLGQWWVLTRRYFRIKRKDLINTLILFVQAPIIAGIIAGVFSGKTEDVFDRIAYTPMAMFLIAISAVWFGCSNSAREIVGELAIYRRERMVNLKIPSYIMSKFTVLGFICAMQCALLLGITDFFLEFNAPFFNLYFFLLLCSLAGVGMGLLLSAMVKTSEAAIALVPLLLIPQVILGGLIIPIDDMAFKPMKALTYPMVARWGFEGLLHAETNEKAFAISDIKIELEEQKILDELKDKRCISEFEYEEPEKPIQKYFASHKDYKSEVGDQFVLLLFNLMLLLSIVAVMKIRDPEA